MSNAQPQSLNHMPFIKASTEGRRVVGVGLGYVVEMSGVDEEGSVAGLGCMIVGEPIGANRDGVGRGGASTVVPCVGIGLSDVTEVS